jgi:flagellar M-ring protein FliF
MTSSVGTYPTRVREWWSVQSGTNRIVVGAIAAVLLVAIVAALAFRAKGPDYGVLFANLGDDEASAVIAKLDSAKIPHRLEDGGHTILVPKDQLYEERVSLAGSGVVKSGGGTGYELFDKTQLGRTDFDEKIDKTRATEGELQRTIASLTPVQSARVHIATPEQTLYSSTQDPTTASIAIATKPGMQLSSDEVAGITRLVAGAVEGLKPENVTIVDQNGTVLRPGALSTANADNNGESALKLTQDQLQAKERFESDLQQSIQGMLDTTLGAHRSAVRVASTLNFDANAVDSKTYGPSTVLSSQTERENYNGTGGAKPPASGVTGTTTNVVPTYQSQQNNTGSSRYTKSKNTTNNDVSEQDVKHVDAPGKVSRLSVAVLVDTPPTNVAAANGGTTTQYEIAPADVQKIRNVVQAAAGLDLARGDQVSVEGMSFAPNATNGRGIGTNTTTVLGIPVTGLVIALIVLVLAGAGGGFAMMRRRSSAFRPMSDLPTFDSSLAEELPSFEEHPMLDGTPAIAAPIRSAADLTREQMIEYVTTVAQETPDSIAKLVKLWLAE